MRMIRQIAAATILSCLAVSSPALAADDGAAPLVVNSAPTRGAVLPSLYVSYVGLQAADVFLTNAGITRGAAEGNPIMSAVVGNTPAMWAVKGGATVGSIYVAERLWRRGQRGQAIALMVASNAFAVAVAARNANVLRHAR